MRMHEFFGCFCFLLKFAYIDIKQMQEFDGCLFGSKMHMLSKVDLCEASFSQQFYKTIISDLLADSVRHGSTPGTTCDNALVLYRELSVKGRQAMSRFLSSPRRLAVLAGEVADGSDRTPQQI